MSDSAVPPAGWHEDPWDQVGSWRYWDGAAWTGHTAPRGGPDRGRAVARAAQAARWARWTAIGTGVCLLGSSMLYPSAIHAFLDGVHRLDDLNGQTSTVSTPTGSLWLQLVGLIQLGSLVPLQIWQFRANVAAKALGLPLTRSPGWGVASWYIPIVNFWFPYRAVLDCLPPDHPERRLVLRWWLGWVATTLFAMGGGLAWLAAPAFGVAVWIAFAAYLGWWVSITRHVIDLVTTAQQDLTQARLDRS